MKNRDDVQNILFCVAKCKQRVGRALIIEILQGSHSVRVFNRRLNQNSAFGSLKDHSTEELDALIQKMIDEGLLQETPDEFPRLELTEESKALLSEDEPGSIS